ncbi:hypothetical protein LWI28_005584 [Acer negundo]|uniref:Uncharacterized protein n=1 Tax=Acer negundo TaxID=4023 RepID=A0AAD5P3S6_ACENE|nr:hypothetical protein LWI28_005584 [Acer negundo]
MYRLHMEDQEVNTPEKIAKVYNTAAETVAEILVSKDFLKNRIPQDKERAEMYSLYKENPEIYTIERLAKDFRVLSLIIGLCPLVSRLSLVARTGATAARILKGKTVPALLNRGIEANRLIETRAFTIKSYFDGGDDCGGGGAGNKENNASGKHDVSTLCPSNFELLGEDLYVIIDWYCTYKDGNSFRGGRHDKMIMLKG